MRKLVLVLSLTLLACGQAFPQVKDPTLFSWINPTTNTDGSALTDLAGTILRCGTRSGVYDLVSVTVNDPTVTTLLISAVVTADGQYFCAVFAFNVPGIESIASNERIFVLTGGGSPPPPSRIAPSAPTGFEVE